MIASSSLADSIKFKIEIKEKFISYSSINSLFINKKNLLSYNN